MTVAYEVEGNGNGGDIVINCPNPTGSGYFIHFLSPNLPPLEKEIIFLIDKSGSMRKARRMQQAKEAMHNILGHDSNDKLLTVRFEETRSKFAKSVLTMVGLNCPKVVGKTDSV